MTDAAEPQRSIINHCIVHGLMPGTPIDRDVLCATRRRQMQVARWLLSTQPYAVYVVNILLINRTIVCRSRCCPHEVDDMTLAEGGSAGGSRSGDAPTRSAALAEIRST